MAGQVARMAEERNAYRGLVEKYQGKRRLGKQRRTWVDNIRIDIKGITWEGLNRIHLA
jgi:hypothetical protein